MSNGRASLRVNGKNMLFYRVIWQTFCPQFPLRKDHTVDHIDQDHDNNYLYNLRRATWSEQNLNKSTTTSAKKTLITCANPNQFFDTKAAFDEAVKRADSNDAIPEDRALQGGLTQAETMARVVECARGVHSKQTQDGMAFRMPARTQVGGALWNSIKSKFTRGEEFALAMDWTVDEAKAFIAEYKSKRSMTTDAVRQREASAKRKREEEQKPDGYRRQHADADWLANLSEDSE